MKHTTLAILFIIHSFKPIVPYVEYAFNYDYISTVLCVNKEKPKLNCDGKCYLAKMLAESETNNPEKGIPVAQLDLLFIPLYFQEALHVAFANFQGNHEKKNFVIPNNEYSYSFSQHLLKPPISDVTTTLV
ncbi:hypothetical protein [Flagellimonas sp.]|uniref:Uncharacterized protein n=1 Tax=Flagellimonas hadalis TaxID=2597517 RepID=A0A5N5ISF5_9FLAO|nr:hypothetical protein FOT42_000545 [Allomuricauda hadalis]